PRAAPSRWVGLRGGTGLLTDLELSDQALLVVEQLRQCLFAPMLLGDVAEDQLYARRLVLLIEDGHPGAADGARATPEVERLLLDHLLSQVFDLVVPLAQLPGNLRGKKLIVSLADDLRAVLAHELAKRLIDEGVAT